MSRRWLCGLSMLLWLLGWPVVAQPLIALSYHDIRDEVDGRLDPDHTAVSSRHLAEQFEWLRQQGYQPVSLAQVREASAAHPLPERPVLLTFDDGYASFYTRVFPLLKLYHYPAVMALVGSWLEVPEGGAVQYGDEKMPRSHFLTAAQIREMQASGLIEFASHSHDLHHGVQGNPQGNQLPAATTLQFDPGRQRYETPVTQARRIRADLQRNHKSLLRLTGVAPRTLVWPYGEWNVPAETQARELGYDRFLLLGEGWQAEPHPQRIHRLLVSGNPDLKAFEDLVMPAQPAQATVRAAHVDLDYVYDADPVQMAANLDRLLERIKRLHLSTVYLQAFADPDGDGNADALYFPNDQLPMRADLFNRVAWQLRTRCGVKVYAWMPVLAFDFGAHFYQGHGVRQWTPGGSVPARQTYRRLSLFDPVAKSRIAAIYRSLAQHASFHGVLFHDDALLDLDEDFHPAARQWFASAGLSLDDYPRWREDPAQRQRFTDLKIRALDAFMDELLAVVREYRPEVRSARNLYAAPVLDAAAVHWFAQSLDSALQHHDQVALMAMPWMEGASDPAAWAQQLAQQLASVSPAERRRIVIELQTKDWRTGKPVAAADFREQVALWKAAGYQHFAWYPDDFISNVPDFSLVYSLLSLEDFPYSRR